METTTSVSTGHSRNALLVKILLYCGILSSLLYIAMNIIVPMRYEGYDWASQTVSELSAVDAPTRPLWVGLVIVYLLLVVAFGWGVWKSAAGNRRLRIMGGLIFIYGVLGLFCPPMHQREVLAAGGGTLTDTMHSVSGGVSVLLMLLSIGFGAAALGKRFRLYSIASLVILVAFAALMTIESPRIAANQPTPWVGVWERIFIAVFMVWVVVLAVILLRKGKASGPLGRVN